MPSGSSGNVAAELEVLFTADGQAGVEAAANSVHQALTSAGAAGQKAGQDIKRGAEEGAQGIVGMMKEIRHFAHEATTIIFPAAIFHEVMEVVNSFKEAAAATDEFRAALSEAGDEQQAHLAALLGKSQQITEYDKERAEINTQLADTQAKITEETEKDMKAHGSLLMAVGSALGLSEKQVDILAQQRNQMVLAEQSRDKQMAALNDGLALETRLANEMEKAKLTGDETNVERLKAARDIEELEKRRASATGEGSDKAKAQLTEAIALRKQELDETLKGIDARREAQLLANMDKATQEALADAAEQQRKEKEAARDAQKEQLDYARELLQVENDIADSLNKQVGAFSLANASFASLAAAQSGAFGQQWSIASRVGR